MSAPLTRQIIEAENRRLTAEAKERSQTLELLVRVIAQTAGLRL